MIAVWSDCTLFVNVSDLVRQVDIESIENFESQRLIQSEYLDFTSCNQHVMPSVEEELDLSNFKQVGFEFLETAN